MLLLRHLKTLQHVSIIIQIVFRELLGSLLKSRNLKCKRSMVVMRQHNVWCMCVTISVGRCVGLQSNTPPHTERHAHTPNVMLPHHHH